MVHSPHSQWFHLIFLFSSCTEVLLCCVNSSFLLLVTVFFLFIYTISSLTEVGLWRAILGSLMCNNRELDAMMFFF